MPLFVVHGFFTISVDGFDDVKYTIASSTSAVASTYPAELDTHVRVRDSTCVVFPARSIFNRVYAQRYLTSELSAGASAAVDKYDPSNLACVVDDAIVFTSAHERARLL